MHSITRAPVAGRRSCRTPGRAPDGAVVVVATPDRHQTARTEVGLRTAGYRTIAVTTGANALGTALDGRSDLLVLAHELPDIDGLTVVRAVRSVGSPLPIVVVAADDTLAAPLLEGGADDFLLAPYAVEELAARVGLRLRRGSRREPAVLSAGPLTLELVARRCRIAGRAIDLTHREFVLAEVFCRHPTQVLSRRQLAHQAWGPDTDPASNVVDVYIGYLRRKLGRDVIETVRGVGYRLGGRA